MPDYSNLFFQEDNVRRSIISAYWLLIVFALPLWWHTTSIERLALPSSRVAEHNLRIPIRLGLEFDFNGSLVLQLQHLIDALVRETPQRWDGLDIRIDKTDIQDVNSEGGSSRYTVVRSDGIAVRRREQAFSVQDSRSVSALADTLSALIVPFASTSGRDHRIARYSPRYRLSFTLLNEDAAAGDYFAGWDVSDAISRQPEHFKGTRAGLMDG